jgi:hypothetical protein
MGAQRVHISKVNGRLRLRYPEKPLGATVELGLFRPYAKM